MTKHPLHDWLSEVRRDFHMHPELGFEEHRTTRRIKEILGELGVAIHDLPGLETGAVALIKGAKPGKTLALRADIDALPLEEMNEVDYRSTIKGRMHACGHDAHAAILLGVIKSVVESGLAENLNGQLLFLFQPAEERVAGAARMIKAGALDIAFPDRVLALHVTPLHQVGEAGFNKGVSHAAADRFAVKITGKGCHGAHPEKGRDPILAASSFVVQAQSVVSRGIGALDSAVVTVGAFHSGTVGNIIPEFAEMEGTIRTLDPEVRAEVLNRLEDLARGVEKTHGVTVEMEIIGINPELVNDDAVAEWFDDMAVRVLGTDKTFWRRPTMGAEDFALFTQKAPGAIMHLGCHNPDNGPFYMLHSPYFDMDEACLPLGVDIFLEAIRDYLA